MRPNSYPGRMGKSSEYGCYSRRGLAATEPMINVIPDVVGRFYFSSPLPRHARSDAVNVDPVLVSLGLGHPLLTAPTSRQTQGSSSSSIKEGAEHGE